MRVIGMGLAAALLLAGCKDEVPVAPGEGGVAVEEGVTYAGADMDGKAVEIAVGETLRVELESIPTAGYVWQITHQPDFLELQAEATRATDPVHQNQQGFTGGNHYLSFDFKALGAGTGTLELVEGRPWELEAGEAPDDTFTLKVTVTE